MKEIIADRAKIRHNDRRWTMQVCFNCADKSKLLVVLGVLKFKHSRLGEVKFRSMLFAGKLHIGCNDGAPIEVFAGAVLTINGYVVGYVTSMDGAQQCYLTSCDLVENPAELK